jgi:hypothetical protein
MNIVDITSFEYLKRIEFNVETIIKDIKIKFSITSICEFHTNYDLDKLQSTFKRMLVMYEKKKKENDTQFNYIYDIIGFENIENKLENNISKQDQIVYREYNDKLEFNEEYMNVKGKISNMNELISIELSKGEQELLEIEDNVEKTNINLIKTNKDLRQAALLRNKSNSIKYPIVLGTILGAFGTVVPVIGNAIGASLGAAMGYGFAKIEKNAIQKIEPEEYK